MTTEDWKTTLYTGAEDTFFKDGFTEERVKELVTAIRSSSSLAGQEATANAIMFIQLAIAVERLEKDNVALKKQVKQLQQSYTGVVQAAALKTHVAAMKEISQ